MYRSNIKLNNVVRNAGMFVLVLSLAFASIAAISPIAAKSPSVSEIAMANYRDAQSSNLSEEDKIKSAISAYFTTRYESQRLLESQDFSPVLENATLEWVRKEMDKREIELYIATLFGLRYLSYNYTLDYDSIKITSYKAVVHLRESHNVVFETSAPVVSKLGNLPHIITLRKKHAMWTIVIDQYQDEGTIALDNQTKQELLAQVDENYKLNQQLTSTHREEAVSSAFYPSPSLKSYSYNRTEAVDYADDFWNTKNPPYYKGLDSDCANFVSQALYAGEGKKPPDKSGMTTSPTRKINTDWYYVWKNSGSKPWINVPAQYTFITKNINKIGPYGQGTTSFCNTQIGDIVQLYSYSRGWFHEGIITLIVNPCGGLQFYYANAHTTNRQHYLLAYWAQYKMRFIKINGWRGK
ncbi:MAG: amidase domain-containing protein [Chloroflexota bacterium]